MGCRCRQGRRVHNCTEAPVLHPNRLSSLVIGILAGVSAWQDERCIFPAFSVFSSFLLKIIRKVMTSAMLPQRSRQESARHCKNAIIYEYAGSCVRSSLCQILPCICHRNKNAPDTKGIGECCCAAWHGPRQTHSDCRMEYTEPSFVRFLTTSSPSSLRGSIKRARCLPKDAGPEGHFCFKCGCSSCIKAVSCL